MSCLMMYSQTPLAEKYKKQGHKSNTITKEAFSQIHKGVTVHKVHGSVCTSVLGLWFRYVFGIARKTKKFRK